MAGIVDRIQTIVALYYILCHLTIMVGAGYITQAEADSLRPAILTLLREALGL